MRYMENFNAKNYRDNLAKDLKDFRKDNPELAEKVLLEEQETIRYKEAEKYNNQDRINRREKARIEKQRAEKQEEEKRKLEKLLEFPSYEFSEYRVDPISPDVHENILKSGNILQKEVFVSIGTEDGNGFELLKAIDDQIKKDKKDFVVYVDRLSIPFQGKDIDESTSDSVGSYLKAEESFFDDYMRPDRTPSHGEDTCQMLVQIRSGKCELLNEWINFYKINFDKVGFHYEKSYTYSSGNDLTMEHLNPKSDVKIMKELYKNFLKNKGVEIVEFEAKDSEKKSKVPIASDKYLMLINKEYTWKTSPYWGRRDQYKKENKARNEEVAQKTLNLITRDERFDSSQFEISNFNNISVYDDNLKYGEILKKSFAEMGLSDVVLINLDNYLNKAKELNNILQINKDKKILTYSFLSKDDIQKKNGRLFVDNNIVFARLPFHPEDVIESLE